ncbi:hypothetical protein JL09_g2260 [Pichia kudriavzevii]|uniref:Uncharacterized protein n=1 Tax=Pichia kudriavzevii TaxID=4909 RepID=A0A099P0X0_PICKU|nr:hypothetical protein JL09_g2260 [Pichia kudriavzevii]
MQFTTVSVLALASVVVADQVLTQIGDGQIQAPTTGNQEVTTKTSTPETTKETTTSSTPAPAPSNETETEFENAAPKAVIGSGLVAIADFNYRILHYYRPMQLTRKQRQYSIVGLSTLAVVGAIAILAKTFPHLNPFASKENSSENGEDGQLLGQDKEQEKKENAEADEIDDDEVEVEESAVLA